MPTGIIRVKVSERRRTKQFISNRQGEFRDLKKIVDYIEQSYLSRKKVHEDEDRQATRERELAPTAARIRAEFDLSEYSGDFCVSATGRGLELGVSVVADADQIRLLLLRAKALGMMSPSEEPERTTPTVWERLNEEQS